MLRGSQQRQQRVLMTVGGAGILCIAVAVTLFVTNPFGGRPEGTYAVAITTPYVGQGVQAGTAVVLHGVKVGEVTDVTNTGGGRVQLATQLLTQPTRGLTDAMNIDFRPINYFGVPGINIVPSSGGQALRDGSKLTLQPKGNFTLSELLNQLGEVSAKSLTPQLISVIDRVTRYTDALNPTIETAVTVTRAVDAVQTVPSEELLKNLSSAFAAFPEFTKTVVEAGTRVDKYDYYPTRVHPAQDPASEVAPLERPYVENVKTPNIGDLSPAFFHDHWKVTLDLIQNGLFAAVGKLVGSHVADLTPLIGGIKAITDTGPVLLRPADVAQKLAELRDRFQKLYEGNGTERAVSVRLVLDSLPGVAAAVGVTMEGQP
ncbi:mammalian cell entry protein [Mycobacterium sp. E1747]|nr:mammalian cell entry protein [Mycobacterium sp. E1747]